MRHDVMKWSFQLYLFVFIFYQTCLPSRRRVICACISEICIFRDFMGLKRQTFSLSLLTRHLYTRKFACEPETGSLAHFSVAARNGTKKRPVFSVEVLHPEACRLLRLLCFYTRTNNVKSSW